MVTVIVFSQNLKLKVLEGYFDILKNNQEHIFLTTHKLFDHEKEYVKRISKNCLFVTFADMLSDEELEECDHVAFSSKQLNVFEYWEDVKQLKNRRIIQKIKNHYKNVEGYIFSDDLGIYENEWIKAGFARIYGEYYYAKKSDKEGNSFKNKIKRNKWVYRRYRRLVNCVTGIKDRKAVTDDIYVSQYKGRKIIFIGRMSRIGYRLDLNFTKSQEERERLQHGQYYSKEQAEYISTLHESGKCTIPDRPNYDVKYIQDGYLPSNYSNYYLKFKPRNVSYYAWDTMGCKLFRNHGLQVEIIPYRKKLYLPIPNFSLSVKKVLIATSGSGDWTALKNRSDDDILLETFIEVARQHPEIEFVYRCHPTWVHPEHVGVNSIVRASMFVEKALLSNIHISSNIPMESLDNFVLSISRSSLEDDMRGCDIVFGEHSVSMIDAGFQKIPFCAVNVTRRRSLFQSMVNLGFPECNSIEEICGLLKNYCQQEFQEGYLEAIQRYNEMTNEEN